MMTIDEAIAKEREKSKEHEQLAEWMEELKRRRNLQEHNYDNCHNITCRRRCEKDGYNKAIDDFTEKLSNICSENSTNVCFGGVLCGILTLDNVTDLIFMVSEQLKAGGENENPVTL